MSEPPQSVFVPAAPFVSDKTIGKTADRVYRQHEDASAAHAEMMAQIAGGSASDYPRVTNMASSLREGDIAAKIANNPVSQAMERQHAGGFQPLLGRSGADYAVTATQGVFPRVGDAMRQDVGSGHTARARVLQAMGELEPRRRR